MGEAECIGDQVGSTIISSGPRELHHVKATKEEIDMFNGIRVPDLALILEAFKMRLRTERDVLSLPFGHN